MDLSEVRNTLYARSAGFSGVDISATVHLPAVSVSQPEFREDVGNDLGVVYQLGSLQTLTYSVYTAKSPVRALGFRNSINHVRGGRTIAGTLIFNQLYNHPFEDRGAASVIDPRIGGILSYSSGDVNYVRNEAFNHGKSSIYEPELTPRHMYDFTWDQRNMGRRMHPSDMPKFDIICTFVNEGGNIGKMILYGVDLVHESSVLSIEDIYTEVTYQYVAQDIEYFHAYDLKQAQQWRSAVLLGEHQDSIEAEDVAQASSTALSRSLNVSGAEFAEGASLGHIAGLFQGAQQRQMNLAAAMHRKNNVERSREANRLDKLRADFLNNRFRGTY